MSGRKLSLLAVASLLAGCSMAHGAPVELEPSVVPSQTSDPGASASVVNSVESAAPVGPTEVPTPVRAGRCDPNAVAQLKATDSAQFVEDLAGNPASNRHDGAFVLPDSASAIALARQRSTSADDIRADLPVPDITDPKAAAVLLPFEAAIAATGAEVSGSEIVNPSRCVWLVTVQELFVTPHGPPGYTPTVFGQYTVIMDQASGEGLGLMAGPDAPDAITGAGLR